MLERFHEKDRIRVKMDDPTSPNKRTPLYVRGKAGTVDACYGSIPDPEFNYDHRTSWGPLYRVSFDWSELYGGDVEKKTKIFLDLHESWLEDAIWILHPKSTTYEDNIET
jgi:hypothetical protein